MSLLLIYNPVCGSSSSKKIVDEQILPLLAQGGRAPDRIVSTEYAGHAGTIVTDFVAENADCTIILVSGDGTLHEIVNALHKKEAVSDPVPTIKLILVPGGTANALHSSLFPPSSETSTILASVQAYLNSTPQFKPLVFSETIIEGPGDATSTAEHPSPVTISAVVTSTSLHASILHDAEVLRASVPSLDRFKLAAAQNATRWYNARLRLLPSTGGEHVPILQYNHVHDQFTTISPADEALELSGPFSYMLSTVNVDRLEPAFRITPLHRTYPPSPPTMMDFVIIRPLRSPHLTGDDGAKRETFKDAIWAAMGAAYQNGAHIKFAYDSKGGVDVGGDGESVVEYFRAAAWEWIPDNTDDRAHLVCADGTIITIPSGGKVISRVLGEQEQRFRVLIYS